MKPGTLTGFVLAATLGLTAAGPALVAQDRSERPEPQGPGGGAAASRRAVPAVVRSVRHDVSPALRDMPPAPPRPKREPHPPLLLREPRRGARLPDPVLQTSAPLTTAPNTIVNFEGVNNTDGVLPPDTNGDIGPNHYVQWVNKTFAVYSRAGAVLYGPAAGSTIWSGFGGPCETQNDGDPIVLYDHLADRWLLSQFAIPNNFFGIFIMAPFYQCIAVSQTPDPTGPYYRYQYEFSKLNDYPKFGVWPDGYYMAINQFTSINLQFAGQGVVAFDRAAMLAGQPANMIYFDLFGVDPNLGGMLPSDLDGPAPPAGSPNYFVQADDDAFGYSQDRLQLWRFHADWTNPSASTFTGPHVLPVAPFDSNMCDFARGCIPQPGTTVGIDALSDRLMYRLQYRNFGTHESLAVNHTVDVDGNDHAGIRWYEVRNPGGTPVLHQQGTFAPDHHHRWMASAAMDAAGNLALAYNTGGSTLSPSIRYAARLTTDPPGVLGQGENDLIIGTGAQTHTASRWGDYSMLGVDPVDGCTFWATAQYMATTSLAGWQTRIGGFRLPGCGSFGPPPDAPANLAASGVSPSRIDLTWTDQSSDETGFSVERCTGTAASCGASGAFSPVGQTSAGIAAYADTSLQPATTFSYRVRAFNSGGNSGYSNVAAATTGPPPSVTVTATTPTASEAGPSNGVFTIVRDAASESPLAVQFTLGGTAVNGSDYQAISGAVTIPAGAASTPVTLVPIDDTLIEPNETAVLTLTASSAYALGTPSTATVTVVSDDLTIDFVVASLSVPSTAGAGTTIQVTDVTRNQGTDTSAPSTTSLYLSTNYALDASDTLLGTRSVPALGPAGTSTGTTSITLPSPLSVGSHVIIAKADGPGELSETSETNNTRTALVNIGPDLAVSALSAPSAAAPGVAFAVTETTKNQGGGSAGATATRFYLSANYQLDASDMALQSRSVPALDSGAVSSSATMVTIPSGTTGGLYYLIAKADDGTAVVEYNENNNTRYVTIRVGGDLVIASLSVPVRAAAGSAIVVNETTANNGAGAVDPSTTAFYFSSDYQLDQADVRLPQSRAVPALASGASSAGSTTVTLPAAAPGRWYLIAQADDGQVIAESSETNNKVYRTIQIGPDLGVSAFSAPGSAVAGSAITVTETTHNSGADAAGSSMTWFYLSRNASVDASDTLLSGTRAVGELAPNGSSAGSTTVTLPTDASGTYYIIAVADGGGVVAESSETNNARVRSITIGQ